TTATIRARAVGGPGPSPGAQIVVLDSAAPDAFLMSGGSTVNIPGGVEVNSSNATKALDLTGASSITAGYIHVTGGDNCGGNCFPDAVNGSPIVPDPLAGVPAPTGYTTTCDPAHTNRTINGSSASLTPGTYCGGIKIQGNGTANLAAGTYVLLGGGLTVSPGNINGTHVTFYSTYDATHAYGPLNIQGGASTATLSAPILGSLAGVLWFADRTAPSGTVNFLSGGGSLSLEGALYMKTQKLKWQGGTTGAAVYTQIV